MGLVTPDIHDGHFRTAHEMVNIYTSLSTKIFPTPSWWDKIKNTTSYFWSYQYSAEPLEKELKAILGDVALSDISMPTLVTAVDAQINQLKLFRSLSSKRDHNENYYLMHVARSTSAAPSYFPIAKTSPKPAPAGVHLIEGERRLVDGGMGANNPAALALAEAYSLFPRHPINLISIGTGAANAKVRAGDDTIYLGRAGPTIEMLFDSQSNAVDNMLKTLRNVDNFEYVRLQAPLEEKLMPLDDSSNISNLHLSARNYLASEEGEKKIGDAVRYLTAALH